MATTRRRRSPATEAPAKKKETKKKDEPRGLRLDFLDALSFIKPGITSGSIIEQSDLVLMDEERLLSYNDEIAISHPFPIGHKGGVSEDELFKLLQKLPSDDIEINEDEEGGKTQLFISCENVEAGFYIVKDVPIPELGIDGLDNWFELPSDFGAGMDFCMSSAATDITKGVLTCLNVEGKTIYSCDNFQATRYTLASPIPKGAVLNVPRSSAKELAKYKPKEAAWNEGWIHFKNDAGTVFSTRTIDQDYPDVKGLFESIDKEATKILLPKELKKTLVRSEILAASDDKTGSKVVRIEVEDGNIICSGEGDAGWVTEKIKTEFKGDCPVFQISPNLLSSILDKAQEAILTERTLLFESKNFSHVVALIAS